MDALNAARPVAYAYVADRDRAAAFYLDKLGLTRLANDDHGDTFAFGDSLLRLTPLPDFKPGDHPVVGWEVGDIDAAVDALAAKGVTMTVYEGMGLDEKGIWRADDGRAALAWFADSEGNCLMLSQHGKQ